MSKPNLRQALRDRLGLAHPGSVDFERESTEDRDGYRRGILRYAGLEGDEISAYLFTPLEPRPTGAVVAFHQHGGQFHLGKSEVAGEAGDPLQAFGPALARSGIIVLAPDALTFEDRRTHTDGTEPTEGDWLQHFNAMAYRLIDGDVLMRECLDDAQRAMSVLLEQENVVPELAGVVGHSYGGTTALYHAVVDDRCRFSAVSGALCSFEARQSAGTGVNMFEVVPGLSSILDARDLVEAIAPRPLLVVSATDDPYSADADRVVGDADSNHVSEIRVEGPHELDPARFDAIVNWVAEQASPAR